MEFPTIEFINLPGYNINYATSGIGTYLTILKQIPGIIRAIKQEHYWLNQLISRQKPDLIISDNRYGIYSPHIPSVLVTHQLLIKTGAGKVADLLLQKLLFRLINRFRYCWVPDEQGDPNCAGTLSHPQTLPAKPVRYIGCLSRFKNCTNSVEKGFVLIILSGPEPQRSIFEQINVTQARGRYEQFVIVRGLQNIRALQNTPSNVKVIDFADASELNKMICEANVIIARSGYTTVMDILSLQKRSVLIPTPGQTEQMYLAKHLMKNNFAWTVPQEEFTMQKAIDASIHFEYKFPQFDMKQYKQVIGEFVEQWRGCSGASFFS